jgi:L-lactate utilization protein LutC
VKSKSDGDNLKGLNANGILLRLGVWRNHMDSPIENYWEARLGRLREELESNNFEVYSAADGAEAKRIVQKEIIPTTGVNRISWGGSKTATDMGLIRALKADTNFEFLDPFEKEISLEDSLERRRQAFLVDLFITGTNALTETGLLVNLDRTGNRVAAITFGPKVVVILVGRNKIVSDLDEAFFRVKDYAAPLVAMRINAKTPCVKTSFCEDCISPERVCSAWGIVEKSYPKGRIKVVLINQSLGF